MIDQVEVTFGPGSMPISAVYKLLQAHWVTGYGPGTLVQGQVPNTGTGMVSAE